MIEDICKNQELVLVYGYAALMLIEYFLGKSQRVKPNSILDFILTGLTTVVKFIIRRR